MVSLTIDGKNVEVEKGTTILEAAARVGIVIPTLCWLQKVSPTGACRVCAVEVEGVDRPMTACNTTVKEGINVTTESPTLAAIRRKVVELLLVNHPLDCPVCDAAGECDLQNSCYNLGASKQEYAAVLERRPIRYDWPLIESDPNRCILCEKCVKVDHEVVGADAIEVANCGEATIIDTVSGKPLDCEFCGNCVGVCPTGTLISKPFKFRGRPWAFKVMPSTCAFCSAGCQIEYHTRNGKVERVTSGDTTYNSGNLCINGRFGYSYLNSPLRLTTPLVKGEDGLKETDWNRAMETAVQKLKGIVAAHGADAVAGIASPRATNEDNYLFQKLFRSAIGTNNIDSEARLGYAQAQSILGASLGLSGASNPIDRIDTAAVTLVIGCDPNAESTGVEYRVIKAATKNDGKLILANMRDVKLKKFANTHLRYRPGGEPALITALTKIVVEEGGYDREFVAANALPIEDLKSRLAPLAVSDLAAAAGVPEAALREAARLMCGKKSVAILFGNDLMRSLHAAGAISALVNLALLTGAVGKTTGGLFPLYEKTNIQGLLDMGCRPDSLPGAPGKDLWQILEGIEQGTVKALYLFGSDPLTSFPESGRFRAAFDKLDLLIVQDIFATEAAKRADVVFPAAAAAEKSGTFTTIDNRVQSVEKAVEPPGDAREDWDIFTELYNRIAFVSTAATPADVFAEISTTVAGYSGEATTATGARSKKAYRLPASGLKFAAVDLPASPVTGGASLTLITGPILFHSGTMSTYSENNLEVAPEGYVEVAAVDAKRLGIDDGARVKVSTGAHSIFGAARVGEKVQPGLVFVPHHFREMNVTALLRGNANTAQVTVEKA